MKKLFNYVWVFVIPICCAASCFVEEETETDLVLSFGVDETFDFNTEGAFDETRLISRTEIIADVDIPEGAKVKKVDIEYIATEIEPLPGNTADNGITLSTYYGDQPMFIDKNVNFNSDLEVITGLNSTTVMDLRSQMLNYFDDDFSNDEDIIFTVNGNTSPPGEALNVRVKVRIQGAVTFSTELL